MRPHWKWPSGAIWSPLPGGEGVRGRGSPWIAAPVLVDEPATSAALALREMSELHERDNGDAR